MKKIFIFSFISICIFQLGLCQSDSFDFRKAKWGMSINDVIHSEEGNKYEIENDPSATYLKFLGVSLTNITGYANIYYKFTNNCLVSARIVLFMDFPGCAINCNNPLSLIDKISMIQNNYFATLLKKGYLPHYKWVVQSKDLFYDDERGRNPMTNPSEIEKAYLNLKAREKYLAKDISCRLISDRTYLWFSFNYQIKGEPYYGSSQECESITWKHIASIEASATSIILRKNLNPDF